MTKISIDGIPSCLWGEKSEQVFIAVHGKGGSKENWKELASVCQQKGYQVLSFDLPEHGERKGQAYACNPWNGIHDLRLVLNFARQQWTELNLYAESLGACFSLLAYQEELFQQCLFLSPVLDMTRLIENMMSWAGVDAAKLQAQKEIPTSFGETLSWEYYSFVKNNPITRWGSPTAILYGEKDNLTDRETVEAFVSRFGCDLTVMQGGEHWFHTPEQLEFLKKWVQQSMKRRN